MHSVALYGFARYHVCTCGWCGDENENLLTIIQFSPKLLVGLCQIKYLDYHQQLQVVPAPI